MKKIDVSIPAILTTRLCLRLFLMDLGQTARYQPFDTEDYYIDLPLRSNTPPNRESVLQRIKKYSRRDSDEVFAYQIVETSTLQQTRSVGNHPIADPSTETTSYLGKKVFLQGKMMTKPKVKELNTWVKAQARINSDDRDMAGFDHRNVSIYFPNSATKFLKQRKHSHAIMIGVSNLICFNSKTMLLQTV